jgi:ATP-dependent DNA helicase RecQ
MEYLTRELDDPHAAPCGRCDVCAGPWYDTFVDTDQQRLTRAVLDRVGVPVETRSRLPQGLNRLGVTWNQAGAGGSIPVDQRVAEGRVIARLTDLGWGTRLRNLLRPDAEDRPRDMEVPAEVAPLCLAVLRDWDWLARPVAVAWVPSLSRPKLVESLATGIAKAGHLESLGALDLAPGAGVLPRAGNSAYRVRDVYDRFRIPPTMAARVPHVGGPVLLVDDYVDSRWTMTICGGLLRQAGATGVLPFALASVA